MTVVRARQGDTVDLIAWRERGNEPGLVEAIYDTNRELAELGPVLPAGTGITLPPPPPPKRSGGMKLWD